VGASSGGVLSGVSRVVFRSVLDGMPIVGETALAGMPLSRTLRRRTYPLLAARVTGWLAGLARVTMLPSSNATWDRLVRPALERFAMEFAPVLDPAMLRETQDVLDALRDLPTVTEQRDFSPWNVFDGPDGLIVLDWESGEARGLPGLDLVYFFSHAAFYLERGPAAVVYRRAWSRGTRLGAMHRAHAVEYLAALGLGSELLAPLRLFAWVLHAHSEYTRYHADATGVPSDGQLRRSTFLSLWAEELRHGGAR
jgi:hypothetical protein